jgi:hypothetical protein
MNLIPWRLVDAEVIDHGATPGARPPVGTRQVPPIPGPPVDLSLPPGSLRPGASLLCADCQKLPQPVRVR